MINCYHCENPHGCLGKDFYSYGEIRFCRVQMIWLIEHIVELGEGNWPPNPIGSSYVDLPLTSRRVNKEAYFTKPVELVAEVMTRLNKTREDGAGLMEEIHSGLREHYLLSKSSRKALNFISGWRRKKNYKEWLKERGK